MAHHDRARPPGSPASPADRHSTPELDAIHRALVDAVNDYAIFAMDATGHILTWNAGARKLKGYEKEEIVGRHFSIFYPPAAVASGHPQWELETAVAEGRYEEEGWRIRKDGSRFWANVLITPVLENGVVTGFAKVTRDLTERKRNEEELRRSEERFRLLVQSVKDYGIFMLDPNGFIASWNEGAQRIKGYTADEIVGRHFSTFYPPEDVAADKPGMELRVAAQVGSFEDEGWRVRKDGTLFWGNVVITALRAGDGTLIGYAKVTRDLTDRRAAELKAIEDARRVAEAESANRAKSEFLAAMSHELRTPLNAIGGYTDLLAAGIHGPLTEAQQTSLTRIRVSQQHLLGLINDILNFSRMEAGQLQYDIQPIPLSAAVENVLAMVEVQAAAREITLEHVGADANIRVLADEAKLEQILLNLLTNAIKFTPVGGRVSVQSVRRGDEVKIDVADNGIGIAADKLEAVFEPFVQVGRSLTSAHEGTGLGLAISRDLARAMAGDLTARSALDEGSTFTVTLPAAD
jgi:PAS domain S-box-containing protein